MGDSAVAQRKTLLFVVTEDWYFVSHRLPLAVAARAAGYRVIVACRVGDQRALLESRGLEVRPIRLRRRGATPAQEALAILELRRLYQETSPVIVHHVALKPVVFGSLAAVGVRGVVVVNAIAGLGFLFSSRRLLARVARPAVSVVLRVLLGRGGSVVVVQNESDREELLRGRLARPEQIRLIKGAGVDLTLFAPRAEAAGPPVAAFAGRLIWDKGVGAFVAAARELRRRGVVARFVLIGEPDADNPSAVSGATLEEWRREGVVECWGRQADMPSVLASVHVLCLPSTYGEGVPKILLEAAACGRAVVTTDWPGCRDAVEDGKTGLLVPPGDPVALADALSRLLTDAPTRRRLGGAARELAEREFDVRNVVEATLSIYQDLSE
jgi:glycosyltransferase involved in cell wall biosynthesis